MRNTEFFDFGKKLRVSLIFINYPPEIKFQSSDKEPTALVIIGRSVGLLFRLSVVVIA